jgi:gliding motility-associated-like protein
MNPTVQFTDESTDAYNIIYRLWTFGDWEDSTSALMNPTHTYLDTGIYCASLVIMDMHGCKDTATECLDIEPFPTLYIPDAFTPNGDGLNDVFTAKGRYIKAFDMYIFDRWGMQLYHTNSIDEGWNGTVNGGSTIAQEDTYVYLINVTDAMNNTHKYIGRVTLIK